MPFLSPCPGAAALAVIKSQALPFYDSFFNNPLPYLLSSPVEAIEMYDSNTPPPPPPYSSSPSAMDEDTTTASSPFDSTERRFPPAEEQRLLAAAYLQKASGNTLFATQHYLAAIDAYNLALASTPVYLAPETAILHSNLAACHLKLSAPTLALSHAAEALARRPGWSKPLMRRCRAREMLGTWKELEMAVEEYQVLLGSGKGADAAAAAGEKKDVIKLETELTEGERRECMRGLERCRKLLEEVRSREVSEACKGLKSLGDGLLRPFGMSTADFGMKPDGRGGYSLSFNKGGA